LGGARIPALDAFFASLQSVVASLSAPPLKLAFSTLEVALVVLFGDGAVLVASVLRFRAMLQKKAKKKCIKQQ